MKALGETLQRISNANHTAPAGSGLSESHYTPLCKFHSRSVAAKFKTLLIEHDIDVRAVSTRMYVNIEVTLADREVSSALLRQFLLENSDVEPRPFTRDYDWVFLVAFITIVSAFLVGAIPTIARVMPLAPLAVLVTGVSLSIILERLHRQYRLCDGSVFTIRELLITTALFAINLAAWRWLW